MLPEDAVMARRMFAMPVTKYEVNTGVSWLVSWPCFSYPGANSSSRLFLTKVGHLEALLFFSIM